MLGISLYNFMSSVNSEFYLLLPKLNFFKTFSYRIDLARTFSAMLNKGGERRHHYLVMIRAFYHWVSSYLWTCHIWSLLLLYFIWCSLLPNPGLLFILGLYNTELGSLHVHFVEIFIMNGCWILFFFLQQLK